MTPFTPGPWTVEYEDNCATIVAGDNSLEIARSYGDDLSEEQWLANVRLISAATEMYRALEMHAKYYETGREEDFNRFVLLRDKALAKVDGSKRKETPK